MKLQLNGLSLEQFNEINCILHIDSFLDELSVKASVSDINKCVFDGEILTINYTQKSYIFRSLANLASSKQKFCAKENNVFKQFGIMLDCSRNGIIKIETVKKYIRYLALMGYNTLQLYTEDTYEVDDEPYFGYMRGGYTKSDLKQLDEYAYSYGIELIPCIQTLAHLGAIFKWQPYFAINDITDILLVDDERTYALIDNMLKTIAECFKTRTINIGMDEAFLLGYGNSQKTNPDASRTLLMKKHVERVLEIAKKYGFTCSMWSDMYYRLAFNSYYSDENGSIPDEIKSTVPKDVNLIYWDYYSASESHYSEIMRQHSEFNNQIWFAGGAWTWLGFLPNNSFSIKGNLAAINACKTNNIQHCFLAMWGDNGAECPIFSILPTLVSLSECAYGKSQEVVSEKFFALTGVPFDAFMLLEKPDKVGNFTNGDFTDPSKYLFYNDLFMGVFDTTIDKDLYVEFSKIAKKLKKYSDNKEWGYIFNYVKTLCEVMAIKYPLGINTRELYQKNDKNNLVKLFPVYRKLISKLEQFYSAFEKCWLQEKSSFGFEVQDIRIGGLIKRTQHCLKILQDYCSGEIESIAELNLTLLDYHGNKEQYIKQLSYINNYASSVTVNNL